MQNPNLFKIFTSRLNKLKVSYIVTGAVASIIYGEPRLTHHIDLVVELTDDKADRIVKAFQQVDFYCPPIEAIKLELKRPEGGHFNLIHNETGFKADIYISGRDPLHEWAILNRKRIDFEGELIWLAPPEYVIIRKLQYFKEGKSEKHLKDIASMLAISSGQIDFDLLHAKIEENALQEEWAQIKNFTDEL